MLKKFLFLLIVLCFVQTAFAQNPKQTPVKISAVAPQTLDEKIKAELANFSGKVWIYAKNLDTGKDYALRADEQVRT
ncbi:MAG: hypothetical protein M3525_11185, partial [Acidobacteriota bacterium]|nr:hypothetical protein [Acidobacteriota bacterium]